MNAWIIINAITVVFVIVDCVCFVKALRWKSRRGITWEQWESNGWKRYMPGGGIYLLLKYRP